jgi:hypothetical protein
VDCHQRLAKAINWPSGMLVKTDGDGNCAGSGVPSNGLSRDQKFASLLVIGSEAAALRLF